MGWSKTGFKRIDMKKEFVVGDADSLIALTLEYDSNHKKATFLLNRFNKEETTIIYPDTAIAEAITTLSRKHSNPLLAEYITQQYKDNQLIIEYVNEEVMKLAAELFNPHSSKQNTFFDALVAATAKKLHAEIIFSFDNWYKKQGLQIASELN